MPPFDEVAYQKAVEQIRATSPTGLVSGGRLFHLACQKKLTQQPQIPLTAEEIAGGLDSGRRSSESEQTSMLEIFQTVLPHVEGIRVTDYCSSSPVYELVCHVVQYAHLLRARIDAVTRRRVLELLESWKPSVGEAFAPFFDWRENASSAVVDAEEFLAVIEELRADEEEPSWDVARKRLRAAGAFRQLAARDAIAGLRVALFAPRPSEEVILDALLTISPHLDDLASTREPTEGRQLMQYVVTAAVLVAERLPRASRERIARIGQAWVPLFGEGDASVREDEIVRRCVMPFLVGGRELRWALAKLSSMVPEPPGAST